MRASAAALSSADQTPMTVSGVWSSPTNEGSSIGGFSGSSPLSRSTSTELCGDHRRLSRNRRATTNKQNHREEYQRHSGRQADQELHHKTSIAKPAEIAPGAIM